MATAADLLRQGRRDEVWRKYCGFLDLSIDRFMEIQERLLLEQLDLYKQCELGKMIFGDQVPSDVAEFRQMVPLTTYKDYLPFLNPQLEKEGILPSQTALWARTSGRSSEYGFKWAPYSAEMVRKVGEFVTSSFLLASCSYKGDVVLDAGDVCLYTLAPAPYFTGSAVARGFELELDPKFIPSLEAGDKMDFEDRIREGFKLAMKDGIDLFYGLSSVLVAIAQQFERGSGNMSFSLDMLHPKLLVRVVRGLVRSKLQKRSLLPKDLWKIKGIIAGGMDTSFYSDKIEDYWGVKPLEGYGGTEIGGIALQTWTRKTMTFLPDCNFLEFMPEEDFYRALEEPSYKPETLLLSDVKPGIYQLVITNFHGNAFIRYQTGDLVEITSLSDSQAMINLPQMVFHARADGVIDVSGFTRLTEKSIFHAIEKTEVPYNGWTIRKEYFMDKPILHLYLESKNGLEPSEVCNRIHEKLKVEDAGYAELEAMLGVNPLQITLLPDGAFTTYMERKRSEGADLAHLKPPRINASDKVISELINGNGQTR